MHHHHDNVYEGGLPESFELYVTDIFICLIFTPFTTIMMMICVYMCTKAATLRVLSYTSPSFEQLCQPRMLRQVRDKDERL